LKKRGLGKYRRLSNKVPICWYYRFYQHTRNNDKKMGFDHMCKSWDTPSI